MLELVLKSPRLTSNHIDGMPENIMTAAVPNMPKLFVLAGAHVPMVRMISLGKKWLWM